MKKVFLVALLAIGMTAFAQDQTKPAGKRAEMEKLSPEQRNELMLKGMTLELNLNDSQQKEMAKIIAEQSAKRQAMMAERQANKEKAVKLTADERFARQSKRLDEQKELQDRIRKILTPEQYAKWEQNKAEKREKMLERGGRKDQKMQERK